MTKLKRKILNINEDINVFMIGDMHGEITKLNECLYEFGFNKEKDILIATGDLIDRGEDSFTCLKLINEPWFFSVRGNHEQMMLDYLEDKEKNKADYWIINGGDWFFRLSEDKRKNAAHY